MTKVSPYFARLLFVVATFSAFALAYDLIPGFYKLDVSIKSLGYFVYVIVFLGLSLAFSVGVGATLGFFDAFRPGLKVQVDPRLEAFFNEFSRWFSLGFAFIITALVAPGYASFGSSVIHFTLVFVAIGFAAGFTQVAADKIFGALPSR